MNNKDLVIYNKEGYRINTQIDGDGILYSALYFDKNSTDTYKTQGLYLFENIPGTNNNYTNIDLEKYQIFNTEGIYCYPSTSTEFEIDDITPTLISNQYFTKWLHIKDIHNYTSIGMYITLKNLVTVDPSLDEFFNDSNGIHYNVFQIMKVERDKILIFTESINNTVLLNYSGGGKIKLHNTIEINGELNESFNMTPIFTTDKQRFNLITKDENAGTYTTQHNPLVKEKQEYNIPYNIFTPLSTQDSIIIDLIFKDDNLIVSNDHTYFDSTDNSIIVSYIPSFLKIGDSITPLNTQDTVTPLNSNNLATMIVVDIDKINNKLIIDGSTPLYTEDDYCKIVLSTNKLTLEQNIVYDNNNNLSIAVTFNSIVAAYSDILYDMDGLINLEFKEQTKTLNISSDLINNFYEVVVYSKINGVKSSPLSIINTQTKAYPIIIDETLKEYSYIEPNAECYERKIEITDIESFIVININGKKYLENFDTDIPQTLLNWWNSYHQELEDNLFIKVDTPLGNILNIRGMFPNVDIFVDIVNADFINKYTMYEIQYIKNIFIVEINGVEFKVDFDTSDAITIQNWVDTYYDILESRGVIVGYNNAVNPVQLFFSTSLIDVNLNIKFNLGYLPKLGDDSVVEYPIYKESSFDVISGNKIMSSSYIFTDIFSIGQSISIANNIPLLMNTKYTIIEIEPTYITLSYQGPFEDITNINLNIESENFITHPKFGLSTDLRKAKLVWSWKNTFTENIFLYDFSGDQLKSYNPGFPEYSGIKPLCGIDGNITLQLIKEPNKDIKEINNPQKQQTVFEKIENILEWTDETNVENILPNPLQIFIGYNTKYEMWNSSRLYLDFVEDIKNTFITTKTINTTDPLVDYDYDNVIEFKDEFMSITTSDISFNFSNYGYVKGQIINFQFDDVSGDDNKMVKIQNVGEYVIKNVYPKKIEIEGKFIYDITIQKHPKNSYPTIDPLGNQIMLERLASVTINVVPKTLAYFDFFGETEEEDIRHKINLNNKNNNILQLNDYFIFKSVDINEEGIDWIFMNAKRKELLEIYGDIFNHISSYKSVVNAINFFGYNDLTFNEYFQNVDPENTKFGQIFNLELLQLLDKSTKGYKYDNLAFSRLRNKGFIKTNVFSLGYKVTDSDGNFLNTYSEKEAEIKLLGLKRWLNNNVVPLGAKISDINAQYKQSQKFVLNHETYFNTNFRVEEYSSGVYFDINIIKNIVTNGSNTYDVSVEFKTKEQPILNELFFSYEIKTFNIEIWNNVSYPTNSYVIYEDKYYTNGSNQTTYNDEPTISNLWTETTINNLPYVQSFRNSSHELNITSFTVNELLDPYFEISVYWHSGYANTYSYKRTYNATIYNQPEEYIY